MAQVRITDVSGNVQTLRNVDRATYTSVASVVASGGALDLNFGGADPGYPTHIQYGRNMIVKAEWVPSE